MEEEIKQLDAEHRPPSASSDILGDLNASYDEDEDVELMDLLDGDSLDPTLAFPNPGDLSDELRGRIKKSTLQLKKLFRKAKDQYDEVVEHSAQQAAEGKKPVQVAVVHSETDKQKIGALNQRIRELKEKIEISDSKARSLTVQRLADKKRYEDIIRENEITIGAMNQKIMLAESKKRYQEQVGRDPNNYVETLTPMEIDALKNEVAGAAARIKALEEDVLAKKQVIDKYTTEMATSQYNLATSERTISKLESRLDDMIKKESHLQDRANEALKVVEAQVTEVSKELEAERAEHQNKTHQIEFLTTKKTELEAIVAKVEAEKKSLKFKCDGMESNEEGLKKEIDSLRARQKVDKEESARQKASFQEKLKAAAQEKEDAEQEWGIRNESLRGKMEAVEEKLKSKSQRSQELESTADELSGKLREEKAESDRLRQELEALKKGASTAMKMQRAFSSRAEFVDDGSEAVAASEPAANNPQRRKFSSTESLNSVVEDSEEGSLEAKEFHEMTGKNGNSTPRIVDHHSDDETDAGLSVASAPVGKKKKKAKSSSRGVFSRQSSKVDRSDKANSSFQSQSSAVDVNSDQVSSDNESAQVGGEDNRPTVKSQKRPKSKKTIKPSSPNPAPSMADSAPVANGEDKTSKPAPTVAKKIKPPKGPARVQKEVKVVASTVVSDSVAADPDATYPSAPAEGNTHADSDLSEEEGSDKSEEEFASEEEQDKEIVITPFSEERMKKLLLELNAEQSNFNSALKFCAILEMSSRMGLQDSLNHVKNPNLAHEQTSLAALKLAKDLFLQARKYSIEKLKKAGDQHLKEKPSSESEAGIGANAARPSTVGDVPSVSLTGPLFDKFEDKEVENDADMNFQFPGSSDVDEFISANGLLPVEAEPPREDHSELIQSLRDEIDSLHRQVKGMRGVAKKRSPAAEEKKKQPIIIRNRRVIEDTKETGKLFRTFYRAKSTVSVEESEEGFNEAAEEQCLRDEAVEGDINTDENYSAVQEFDCAESEDQAEEEELEYELSDEILEDICFLRGINVGANEILLPVDQVDISDSDECVLASAFSALLDGRFGGADLVSLTLRERRILSLQYYVRKCRLNLSQSERDATDDVTVHKSTLEKYQGLLKEATENFDNMQLAIIPRKYAADKLARLLSALDKETTLLSVMYCWFRIQFKKHAGSKAQHNSKKDYLKSFGTKLAVLNLHRHVVEICLRAAGGWDTAMTYLSRRSDISKQELRTFPESKQIKLLHGKVEHAEKLAAKAQSYYESSKESQRQLQELISVERQFAEQEKAYAQEQLSALREELANAESARELNGPDESGADTTAAPTAPEISIPNTLTKDPSFGPSIFRQASSFSSMRMGSQISDGMILHHTIEDVNLVTSSFNVGIQSFLGTPQRSFDLKSTGITPIKEMPQLPSPNKAPGLTYLSIPLKMIGSVQAALGSKARELTKELLRSFTLWIDGNLEDTAISLKECMQYCPLPEESTVEHDVVDALLDLVGMNYSNVTELQKLKDSLKTASSTANDEGKNLLANRTHRAGEGDDGEGAKRLGGLKLKGVAASMGKKKGALSKALKATIGPMDFIAKLKDKMNAKYMFGEFQREHAQSRYHAAVLAVNKASEAGDSAAYAEAQGKLLQSQILLLQKHVNTTTAANEQRAKYTESATQTAVEDLMVDGTDLEMAQKDETLAAHKEPAGFYIVTVSSGGYARPGLDSTTGSLLTCDTGLELCTGITLACVTDLMQTLFNMMFDENGESLGEVANPKGYTWAEITRSFEDLPAGIALAYKAQRHSFNKGIREWLHGPVDFPILRELLPKQIRMVVLPRLLQVTPEVCMVPGIDLGPTVKLPIDAWAIQGAFAPGGKKNGLPPCMTIVRLSPQLRASRALVDLLGDTVEMMQMKSTTPSDAGPQVKPADEGTTKESEAPTPPPSSAPSAPTMLPLSFPVNYEFAPGVKGAPFPELLREAIIDAAECTGIAWSLPPGVQFVSRSAGTSVPNCLCSVLNPDAKLNADMSAADQLALSCTVLKTPHGVDLPEGCVLIVRPISAHNGMTIPLPHGMSFVPDEDFPPGLSLAEGINLVKLPVRYDFPPNTVIAPDVTIRMCPLGVHLPENVQLVNRKPGTEFPPGVQPVSLPTLPKGTHIPANVEAIRFLNGTNLCSGAKLAHGVEIVGLEGADQKIVIPPGILLIRRAKGVELPPGIVRGLKQDLPAGILLPGGVEVVKILPRFELPAGVQLAAGAILPGGIDLRAGTRVGNGYRIERCPQGMFLPPGMALLSKERSELYDDLEWNTVLPNGFEKVTTFKLQDALRASRHTNQAVYVPLNCFIVGLPHALHLPSGLQLAETFSLLDTEALDPPLLPGLVMIRRPKHSALPSELQLIPPSKLSPSWELPEGGEILGVTPVYEWPTGVELFVGYEIVAKPIDLAIPVDMCLLRPIPNHFHRISDPAVLNKLGVKVINTKKMSSVIAKIVAELPEKGCILAYLDSMKVKIKTWGPSAPGLQVVEKVPTFILPQNCFLVICKSGMDLPPFFKKTPKDFFVGYETVPPGVTVVELAPRYFLPRGIGGVSAKSLPPSIELSPGEWLGPGVIAVALPAAIQTKLPPGVHAGYCLDSKSSDFDVTAVRTPAGCVLRDIDLIETKVDDDTAESTPVKSDFHSVVLLEIETELAPLHKRIPTMTESSHSYNNRKGLAPTLKPMESSTIRPGSEPEGDGPAAVLAAAAETAPQFIHPIIVPPGEVSFARPGGATTASNPKENKPTVATPVDGEKTTIPNNPAAEKPGLFSKKSMKAIINFDEGVTEPQAVVELREENLTLRDKNNKLAADILIWSSKYDKVIENLNVEKSRCDELTKNLNDSSKENAKRAAKFKLQKDDLLNEIDELQDTVAGLQDNIADLTADLDHEKIMREADAHVESNPRLRAVVDEAVEHRTVVAIQEALGQVRAQLMESFVATIVPQIVGSACTLVSDFIEIHDKVHKSFSMLPQTKMYKQVPAAAPTELSVGIDGPKVLTMEDSTTSTLQLEAMDSLTRSGYANVGTQDSKLELTDEDCIIPESAGRAKSRGGSRPSTTGNSRPGSKAGVKVSQVMDPVSRAVGAGPMDVAAAVSEVFDDNSLYTVDFKAASVLETAAAQQVAKERDSKVYHLANKPVTLLDYRVLRATQDPQAHDQPWARDLVVEIESKLRGKGVDGSTPGIYTVDGRNLHAAKPKYDIDEAVNQLMGQVVASIDWGHLSSPGEFNGDLSPFVDFNGLQNMLVTWRQSTLEALVKYYEDITFSYSISFRLMEKEVDGVMKKIKMLSKQLQQTTEVVATLAGVNGATMEGFLHREEALKRRIVALQDELTEIRYNGSAPTIERLKSLVKDGADLTEQDKRLQLCALVLKRQYQKESKQLERITAVLDTKLSKSDVHALENERKAISQLMKSLTKRSTNFLERAARCREDHEEVIHYIHQEITTFHRLVQGVVPVQTLTQLTNSGATLKRGSMSMRNLGSSVGAGPEVPSSSMSVDSGGGLFTRGSDAGNKKASAFPPPLRDKTLAPLNPFKSQDAKLFSLSQSFDAAPVQQSLPKKNPSLSQITSSNTYLVDPRKFRK